MRAQVICGAGSSPQARGTRSNRTSLMPYVRFIPAGAGNTRVIFGGCKNRAVHPRRRGEHISTRPQPHTPVGSSPQARGTHASAPTNVVIYRFIPAGAGNTEGHGHRVEEDPVHPRRRGEHIVTAAYQHSEIGSSPQARGTLTIATAPRICSRFIPAGAGNTLRLHPRSLKMSVHPRRRGEHRPSVYM